MLTILILLSLYAVSKVIANIIQQQKCIDDLTIRKFMTDSLTDQKRSLVISHLGICEKCQERLHDYTPETGLEDHLIDREET